MRIIHLLNSDGRDVKPSIRCLAEDTNPPIARRGRMLLELVDYLESHGPAPSAFGHLSGQELWLTPANRYNKARVHIGVDGRDYGPLRDGLPEMHYRLVISRRAGLPPHREERVSELSEVERLIWEAFGWAPRVEVKLG